MRVVLALVVGLLVSWCPLPARALPHLPPAERARLESGEVVLLDRLPPGGGGAAGEGGTAVSVVHASVGAVWRVLLDYPGHAGLYPSVVRADVLESDRSRALVRYVIQVGPFSFNFHVNNYPDRANNRIDWRLARDRPNGLFRDTWGYWEVQPDASGVLLTYAMGARTVLPRFLTRGAERDGLVETIRAVRDRAERTP
ncbi:MAG TPA: SRPBCC family protein [Methylomirabilota bacterium]|nr:SRPBCC family protein [Methylomirabilota bacterium]